MLGVRRLLLNVVGERHAEGVFSRGHMHLELAVPSGVETAAALVSKIPQSAFGADAIVVAHVE